MTHDFLQRVANGTSFDVRWSLVAQAIPENARAVCFKNVNLPERYYLRYSIDSSDYPWILQPHPFFFFQCGLIGPKVIY